MRFLLRSDGFVDAAELVLNAIDLMPRGFALLVIELRGCGACQPTMRSVRDGGHHFQIAQQFGAGPGWSFLLRLPLGFEKELRIIQKAFTDRGRTFAPRGIQLAGFTRIAVMLGKDCGHPLAILQALSCHRYQELQGYLRQDLALAHLLLDRLRQNLHQRQPPRYPAHAAIQPPRQLIESVAEALLQLGQQPAHLERGLVFGQAQRAVQQHCRSLAHRPHHHFNCVPAQLLQSRDSLIAVNNHVTVRLIFSRYHHDGRLLSAVGQRCQQPPLPRRMVHSQVLPPSIELVKLQLHQTG
jgi:hypothetical protein